MKSKDLKTAVKNKHEKGDGLATIEGVVIGE